MDTPTGLTLPLGKYPPELLKKLLSRAPIFDPRVRQGPGIGLDCGVVDLGETCLVFKSDPITFASEEIGWYVVQVNANDIATTGAVPRWLTLTMLLPEGKTTPESVDHISDQVFAACRSLGISVIGGHTEITAGLERPILIGNMIGETTREKLIIPSQAQPGDRLLLTKSIPVEATAIAAREFRTRLAGHLSEAELKQAANFLYQPGISVVPDAQLAQLVGEVHAMHDPTEGGLVTAVWEVAEACGQTCVINCDQVPILPLSLKICQALQIDPLASIASGALLIAAPASDSLQIISALQQTGIACTDIGWIEKGPALAWDISSGTRQPLPRPERDEIARLFES